MPANIEIKARLADFERVQETAAALSDGPVTVIHQEDTFFNTPQGRLKLRIQDDGRGQLIYYLRPDMSGPKHSEYYIFNTADPAELKAILGKAYGVRGVVIKTRHLYLVGQTRIHLDLVEGLGAFMELEVVLHLGQADSEGQAVAEQLMNALGVKPGDLIDGAYLDLVQP